MVISAAKRKKRFKAQLEREWGTKAYAAWNASDFHSPYPDQYCKILKDAGCKCQIMPSIRQEYANRDYQNVWTSCRNYNTIIKKKRR